MIIIAEFVGGNILGFNVTGLAWFIPFLAALVIIFKNTKNISFPISLWLPWIFLLITHLILLDWSMLDPRVNPLQRTAQVLSPLIIGMAASTIILNDIQKKQLFFLLQIIAVLLFIFVIFGYYSRVINASPFSLAPQVMTSLLLGTFFITHFFMFYEKKDLFLFFVMIIVPILAVTRSVALITLITSFTTFNSISFLKRLKLLLLSVIFIAIAFNLPQFQDKFFFSGSGSVLDLSLDNPDFVTSGRTLLWDELKDRADNNPVFGHGTGFSESVSYALSDIAYPHNDWLLIYGDYGIVGLIVYITSNLLMLFACLKSARKSNIQTTKFYLIASASTFIPFFLVMFTDNIMVYSSFFGNLQFLIIGLGFAAMKFDKVNTH